MVQSFINELFSLFSATNPSPWELSINEHKVYFSDVTKVWLQVQSFCKCTDFKTVKVVFLKLRANTGISSVSDIWNMFSYDVPKIRSLSYSWWCSMTSILSMHQIQSGWEGERLDYLLSKFLSLLILETSNHFGNLWIALKLRLNWHPLVKTDLLLLNKCYQTWHSNRATTTNWLINN